MQVTVFHPGTQHSWQTALALQRLGRLRTYRTSIFYQANKFPYNLQSRLPKSLAQRLESEFARFQHPGLDPDLVQTTGLLEWAERIASRAGLPRVARGLDAWGNHRFAKQMASAIASPQPFALWGYNASSLSSFELGKAAGRPLILDRTIGDFRRYNQLMNKVAETHGEWISKVDRRFPIGQIERDQREYELADVILAGSEFCADTVREWGGLGIANKIRVLPYCFDEALFAAAPRPRPLVPGAPLKFLFIGQVSARKGVQHLLEAFAKIPASAASLTIVGEMRVPARTFARYADRVTYIPSVARSAIPAIMAQHHVLVFPSYFEGSALSLLEALASGMGVIQTRAAGNGATSTTGLVLDEPSSEGVCDALMAAIDDRQMVDGWRSEAQSEAQCYSFAAYRQNIANLLFDLSL